MHPQTNIIGTRSDGSPIFAILGADDATSELNELLDQASAAEAATDEELAEIESSLMEAAEAAAASLDTEALERINEALNGDAGIRAEAAKRITASEEASARVAELMTSIAPVAETDPDPDDVDPDAADPDDAPATPPADPPAPVVVEVEPVAPVAVPVVKPIAASAPIAPVVPIKRPMPTPPAGRTAKPKARTQALVAAGDVPGHSAGMSMNPNDLVNAWRDKTEAVMDSPGKYPVAKVYDNDFPEDRMLTGDPARDSEKIEAAIGQQAIVAAGGLCAPLTPRYELPGIATEGRPIRDVLASFRATRGGISVPVAPRLADVDGSIARFTAAQDTSGDDYPKPCLTVECGDFVPVTVEAQTGCIITGTWQRLFYPEQFNRFWQLVAAAQAREAENNLWTKMCAASTQLSAGKVLGTFRDIIGISARAAAAFRSRHRTLANAPLRFGAPAWLYDQMIVDLVRQMPGDDVTGRAAAVIAAAFAQINVTPFWSLEAGGQEFGDEVGATPLDGWPTTVEALIFPEGTFLHLDGGRLDLGTEIRHTTEIEANNAKAFQETWETVAFIGVESLCVTFTVCPDGSAGVLKSVACVGS